MVLLCWFAVDCFGGLLELLPDLVCDAFWCVRWFMLNCLFVDVECFAVVLLLVRFDVFTCFACWLE